ncbi:hypothetical protein [Geminicoccus flavidas]|uniref:hypothetical protein n=1 Tax=Geminicoccus flavidas TaxID=2506407 RepID=UPI00135AEBF0|nr:hypothetical protein [Geminicoccus flavidas]
MSSTLVRQPLGLVCRDIPPLGGLELALIVSQPEYFADLSLAGLRRHLHELIRAERRSCSWTSPVLTAFEARQMHASCLFERRPPYTGR